MKTGILRIAAIIIAVVAVLDPAVTASRRSRPLVAINGGTSEPALAAAVAAELERRFTVVRGVTDLASATVLVGSLPDESYIPDGATFGVVRHPEELDLRIVRVDAPAQAAPGSRIPVDISMAMNGVSGREVVAELWEGETRVAHATVRATGDNWQVAHMSFVSTGRSGSLRAVARIAGTDVVDSAFTRSAARDERLSVLFFDLNPTWSSTFIRRALGDDARFSVVHRVHTSRGLSNTAGPAPATLRDYETLRDFDVIVVGAPALLAEPDVRGLEAFMRRRGGRVVLLVEGGTNPALDRLTGVSNWRVSQSAAAVAIRDASGRSILRARDLIWPGVLPADAIALASAVSRDSSTRAIHWSVPVGAGRLILHGARDAWQFRGDTAGFESFWRSAIAEYAVKSPSPIDAQLSNRVLRRGEATTMRVRIRDAFLSNAPHRNARASAVLIASGESTFVRLWPERTPGSFSARVVAPRVTGTGTLLVQSGADRAEVPINFDDASVQRRPDSRAMLESFVSSRGGRVIDDDALATLPDLIASAVQTVSRVETWHPMRSPWWLVPFVLLLGAEWWWRRRHGMA